MALTSHILKSLGAKARVGFLGWVKPYVLLVISRAVRRVGSLLKENGIMARRFKLRKSTIYVWDAEEGEWIVLSGEKVVRSRKAGMKRLHELRAKERRIHGHAST